MFFRLVNRGWCFLESLQSAKDLVDFLIRFEVISFFILEVSSFDGELLVYGGWLGFKGSEILEKQKY